MSNPDEEVFASHSFHEALFQRDEHAPYFFCPDALLGLAVRYISEDVECKHLVVGSDEGLILLIKGVRLHVLHSIKHSAKKDKNRDQQALLLRELACLSLATYLSYAAYSLQLTVLWTI